MTSWRLVSWVYGKRRIISLFVCHLLGRIVRRDGLLLFCMYMCYLNDADQTDEAAEHDQTTGYSDQTGFGACTGNAGGASSQDQQEGFSPGGQLCRLGGDVFRENVHGIYEQFQENKPSRQQDHAGQYRKQPVKDRAFPRFMAVIVVRGFGPVNGNCFSDPVQICPGEPEKQREHAA